MIEPIERRALGLRFRPPLANLGMRGYPAVINPKEALMCKIYTPPLLSSQMFRSTLVALVVTVAPAILCPLSAAQEEPMPVQKFDFADKSFWNKTYAIPSNQGSDIVNLSTSDPAGLEAYMSSTFWKNGGAKVSFEQAGMGITGNCGSSWANQSIQYPRNGFIGFNGLTYFGVWDMPRGPMELAVKEVISRGTLVAYQKDNFFVPSSDINEVKAKISELNLERKFVVEHAPGAHGILSVLDAREKQLISISERYKKFEENPKVSVCIRKE